MKGFDKAAAVLSLLGDELSHKILSYLPEEDAISIIKASENLKTPTRDALLDIVSEFNGYMQSAEKPAPGSPSSEAVPSEENVHPPGTPIEIIERALPEALAKTLQGERPEVAAFVLSHLPVEKIYEVLTLLGDARGLVESRLISIKDVPIAKELEDKILKTISGRLV